MIEVGFYHLTRRPLEAVLPRLLEKAYEAGHRILVHAPAEQLRHLDELLWTYADQSFLPHGTADAAQQPILLSTASANTNAADVLVQLAPPFAVDAPGYKRIIILFDERDTDALLAARAAWASLASTDVARTYWQQDERGRWVKAR